MIMLIGAIKFQFHDDLTDILETRTWDSIEEVTNSYKEFVVTSRNFGQIPGPYEAWDLEGLVEEDSLDAPDFVWTWGEDPDHGVWVECARLT